MRMWEYCVILTVFPHEFIFMVCTFWTDKSWLFLFDVKIESIEFSKFILLTWFWFAFVIILHKLFMKMTCKGHIMKNLSLWITKFATLENYICVLATITWLNTKWATTPSYMARKDYYNPRYLSRKILSIVS